MIDSKMRIGSSQETAMLDNCRSGYRLQLQEKIMRNRESNILDDIVSNCDSSSLMLDVACLCDDEREIEFLGIISYVALNNYG